MNLTDRAAIAIITSSAQTCGAKLPKPVLTAQTRAETIAGRLRDLRTTETALAQAVADALADDRDPATDAAVRRLATARAIGTENIATKVETCVADDLRDTFREHADAIVASFQKPYAEAAGQLEAAHEVLGDVQLDETGAILNAGPAAAEAWAVARRALEVVNAAAQAFSALVGFTGIGQVNPHLSGLRFAAVDWSTWTEHQFGAADRRVKPWDLVCAGVPLTLPTPTEYADRVATIAEGSRLAQAEADARNLASLTGRA